MKLKDLPQPIRELAEKRIREQGEIVTENATVGSFFWNKTEEGTLFWDKIYSGNFTVFYEKYPENNSMSIASPEQPTQYTLEQLREEKIAVLVENQDQKRILGIKLNEHGIGYYWRYIKNDWYYNDDKNERYFGHEYINFSQVILPEPKQEVQPPHYKQTTIEPITVIQDWKLSFCLGNVVKYIGRAEHKGNKLADLEMAADYLRMEIESLKTK